MCDFKPGDEVVCVDDATLHGSDAPPKGIAKGGVYTVAAVGPSPTNNPIVRGRLVVFLVGTQNTGTVTGLDIGYAPSRFRKVQRRDLTEWLATENTIEEPRRSPAKKRERV